MKTWFSKLKVWKATKRITFELGLGHNFNLCRKSHRLQVSVLVFANQTNQFIVHDHKVTKKGNKCEWARGRWGLSLDSVSAVQVVFGYFKLFLSSSWRRWYDSFHLSSMQSEGESTFELLLKPTVTSNYNAKPSDKDQEVEKKRILFRSVFVLSW